MGTRRESESEQASQELSLCGEQERLCIVVPASGKSGLALERYGTSRTRGAPIATPPV